MTVGNWIDSQAGVINSLTYTVSNDSPWEIALNEPTAGGIREMVLPHIVDVSLGFTPIGVQTQGKDQLAKKTNQQSNIAQNWNGANESSNYIFPTASISAGAPGANPSKLY
jgi:activator of HSP90 ATPase